MIVEKTLTGMIVISETVNGHLFTRRFFGWTKKEAISKFKAQVKSIKEAIKKFKQLIKAEKQKCN